MDLMEQNNTEAPATEEPLIRNRYADAMTPKRLPKKAKLAIGAAVLALLVGGGLFAASKLHKEDAEVEGTAFSEIGYLETYVEGEGVTAAKRREQLGKDIKGIVTEVLAAPGDAVQAGDVLLVIDPVNTRKELDQAIKDSEEARKAVEAAERTVRSVQETVNALNVKAPFAGKLIPAEEGELRLSVGDELSAGQLLGTLVDDSTLLLPLYFSQAYMDGITVGMPATVSVAATMTTTSGTVQKVERIDRISPDGNRTFRVTVSFPNPGTLTKGMSAIASVQVNGWPVVPADEGKLEYAREQVIHAESEGKVTAVSGLSYYRYAAGESLVRLSNPDLTDQLESARASVETQRELYAQKQERVAELEALIEQATVISPIDGIVMSMAVRPDDELDGTTAPCVVADMSSVVVKASIQEIDIDKVAVGQPVSITMDMGEDGAFYMGEVTMVSMQAETSEGSRGGSSLVFPVTIEVYADPERPIAPDRSVSFQITTASSPECVTVPSSAIVYTEEGAAVYARPAEGMTLENALPIPEGSEVPEGFVLVPIETGIYDANNTEILSGLEAGVEVFLAAPQDANAFYDDMKG